MTEGEIIKNALAAATELGVSPAIALYNVMSALGYDFGDPVEVEHQAMQYYADTEINPFVQAQVEAKIVIDAGELERLTQWFKRKACTDAWRQSLQQSSGRLASAAATVEAPLDVMTRSLVDILRVGITSFGAPAFNASLGRAIDEIVGHENV